MFVFFFRQPNVFKSEFGHQLIVADVLVHVLKVVSVS